MENTYYFLSLDYNPNPELVEKVLSENVSDIQKVSDTLYTYSCWKAEFSMELLSVEEAIIYRLEDAFKEQEHIFDCFYVSGTLGSTFSFLPDDLKDD